MSLTIDKVEFWSGNVRDEAGGLADVIQPLSEAGADLDCVMAYRQPGRLDGGLVALTPVAGEAAISAAVKAGLELLQATAMLHVEGNDRPGLAAMILRTISSVGVSIRGISAMRIGRRFVAYINLDSEEDADKAMNALKAMKLPKRFAWFEQSAVRALSPGI